MVHTANLSSPVRRFTLPIFEVISGESHCHFSRPIRRFALPICQGLSGGSHYQFVKACPVVHTVNLSRPIRRFTTNLSRPIRWSTLPICQGLSGGPHCQFLKAYPVVHTFSFQSPTQRFTPTVSQVLSGGSNCQFPQVLDHLAGLVVKASTSGAEDPGFESRLRRDYSGSRHTSDLKIGTSVATLPGAWHYRVRAGTGRPCVRILWLGEVESLICSFCLSVSARKIVWADPSLRYTSMLLGR